MDDNPYTSPTHDGADGTVPAPELCCPRCGNQGMQRGMIRSGQSMDWFDQGDEPKFLSFRSKGIRLSSGGISAGAEIIGQRCPACGVIVIVPASN